MTANERLAKIKTRAEAATEGPWEWGQGDLCHLGGFVAGPPIHYEAVWANRASDAKFIAHARTDVPALVKALEAVLAEHQCITERVATFSGSAVISWCQICAPRIEDRWENRYPCPTVEAITEALY